MSKLTNFVNEKLVDLGWSYNELARRAELSSSGVSHVMSGVRNPGFDFCVGIARALGEPPEKILRLARLLPALPPAIAEEGEAINLFRRLDGRARKVIVATMRSLLGLPATPSADEPQTLDELLAYHLEHQTQHLTEEEERAVFDLMKSLRARGTRMSDGVKVESD